MLIKRRALRLWPIVFLVVSLSLVESNKAYALPANFFSLNGTACQTTSGVADWSALTGLGFAPPGHCPANAGGTLPTPTAQTFVDDRQSVDTSYFTGGGSKIGSNMSGWLSGGSSPNKAEIDHAFAAAYSAGSHSVAYFGLDRSDSNGSTDLGYWFFHSSVNCCNASHQFTNALGNLAIHSDGDILVLTDFTQGGVVDTARVYDWRCTTGATPTGQPCGTSTPTSASETGSLQGPLNSQTVPADCGAMTASQFAAASVCIKANSSPITVPWDTLSGANGAVPANEFQEGGIDLTQLFPGATCLNSYMAMTDSSFSLSSSVGKDFALGGFQTCKARISLTPPTAANPVGNTHTITATIQYQVGGGSYQSAPDGTKATPAVTTNNGASVTTGGTCATTGTVNGQCTITVTSSTPTIVTVNASTSFVAGGQALTASTTDPGNVTLGGTGAVKKWFVDGSLSIDSNSTNEIGVSHTFTITAKADTGDGTGPQPASGVTFSDLHVTNANGATGSITGGTCTSGGSTNSSGQCTVTVSSPTSGTVTVHATGSFSVTPSGCTASTGCTATFSRSVDGSISSGNGVKTYVNASIAISPQTATNAVSQTETYTVTVKKDIGDGNGLSTPASGASVTASITHDTTGTAQIISGGTCSPSGTTDANGQCTVIIKATTAGQVTVSATASLTVTANGQTSATITRTTDGTGSNSGPAIKTYVDAGITIGPSPATNGIGVPHTFTVQLYANFGDGNGFVAYHQANITVSTSITKDTTGAAQIVGGSCGAASGTTGSGPTDANGQCTVTIVSSKVGEVDVSATATYALTANGNTSQSMTVTTNGTGNMPSSGPAQKFYVAGNVSVNKSIQVGIFAPENQPTVCYTLSYDASFTGPFSSPISTDVTGSSGNPTYTTGTDGSGHANMKECYVYPQNTSGAITTESFQFVFHNVPDATFALHETVSPSPPYTANADITGIAVTDSQTIAAPDQTNSLPNGALQVTKEINGGTVPVPSGQTFTFHVYYCGANSTATSCGSTTDVTGAPLQITGDGTHLTLSQSLSNLPEGYYEVYEDPALMPSCCTIDPTAGNNPQIVKVVAGGAAGAAAATINNLRLLKMVIFTCDMQNNLIQSQSTLSNAPDGQTGAVNTGPNLSGTGLTASQVCQLGPANYQQLQPNTTYNPSIHTGS